nr:hypothetical protein [uncultured Mediterraneibacter sp.]
MKNSITGHNNLIKYIIFPAMFLLLLAGGAVCLYFLRDRGPKLEETAVAYYLPNGQVNTDPSEITMPGFETLYMNARTREVDTALPNPEGNPCYFTYQIIMADTGEELYSTDALEPGTAVRGFVMEKDLEPGSYDIEIRITTGQLDDYTEPMNSGTINAILEVV